MQITNGKVTFERAVRPADYETKRAIVELSFTVADGEDAGAVVERVGQIAQEKALQLVGLKPAASGNTASSVAAAPPSAQGGKEAVAAVLNAADKKPRPGRPPKVAPAADAAAVVEEPAGKGNDTDLQMSADAAKVAHAAAEVVEEANADDAILGAESAPEVTDKDITDAITRKNAALQKTIGKESPIKLRALIAKFAGPVPKASRDIPQASRRKFLDELEVLS